MLAELVFVSRFLGLVAGEQQVALETDAAVRRVEILREGELLASLNGPPWRTVIDLGPDLVPQELTAVGFDAEGREIDRVTQVLNLSRPRAELDVLVSRAADGTWSAALRWEHLRKQEPEKITVRLDGREVPAKDATARLGLLDSSSLHVVSAKVEFRDGIEARREIVFGGVYAEEMQSELTPVAVRWSGGNGIGKGCNIEIGARTVVPAAEEPGRASVSFVLNGITSMALSGENWSRLGRLTEIPATDFRIVSPVARAPGSANDTALFPVVVLSGRAGLPSVLTHIDRRPGPKRFADAAAVAGVHALGGRRAVVMILGRNPHGDRSGYAPATVRRYLERIGVPMRVWSLTGPRPDLAGTWGEVRDISTAAGILDAVKELRQELESQRMVWVAATPLDAWRARAGERCGFTTLARAEP